MERDSAGLVEFIEPRRTLADYHGQEALKTWLRQDIALWRAGDLKALPMGYLLCGPVGTGKTFLVECLAGEAGVPVVKLKNFRDRWVGSSEGNSREDLPADPCAGPLHGVHRRGRPDAGQARFRRETTADCRAASTR